MSPVNAVRVMLPIEVGLLMPYFINEVPYKIYIVHFFHLPRGDRPT
jgi:hypothetical protein